MSKTVVGLFSTTAQAQQVKDTLVADGYSSGDIKIVSNDHNEGHAEGTSIGQKISHFFGSLTGSDEETHQYYTRGVNQGGALLSVDAADAEAESIAATLKEYGARDIDGGYGQQAASGTPVYGGSTTSSSTNGEVIPIVEENLVVGKREVDRGGVRVFSRVVEEPVSADVTLRDEFVNVERRVVDRPATGADFQTGTTGFEVRASGEEAVVGKTSRVVEEIVVGKEATSHTESVHDTVRRTEVDVENIAGETYAGGTAIPDKDRRL